MGAPMGIDYAALGDEALAELAAGGDGNAIEAIYAAYRNLIRSKANLYFMVGAERDDVIQEGMIGLFTAIRSYNKHAGASFATFAELCIKRQIINAVKMAGRKKHMPLNDSVPIDAPAGDEGEPFDMPGDRTATDPAEIVLLADLLEYVTANAPAAFSPMEQKVWEAHVGGSTIAEISAALGKPHKSVDNTLRRIRAKVGRLIALY